MLQEKLKLFFFKDKIEVHLDSNKCACMYLSHCFTLQSSFAFQEESAHERIFRPGISGTAIAFTQKIWHKLICM